jgi:hypothetical protein
VKSPPDLGPLPHSDENAALQRESFASLHALLPAREFILRDERAEDYGVDASLEVLVGGRATNCRSQVQLKGRSGLTPNADHSVSVQIETPNLNYLLNGPCPLYVLYRPEEKELRYVFARDEQRRILATVPDWPEQGSVTFRFRDVLTAGALPGIRDRIVAEAKFHRQLRDTLLTLAPASPARLEIDESLLAATSGDEAARRLVADGMSLVSWGFGLRVLELGKLLSSAHYRANPKLWLVLGFAEFSNRNFGRAAPSLRQAQSSREQLAEDESHFLAFLINIVDMAMGAIDADTFEARAATWRQAAPDYLRLQYDIIDGWNRVARAGAAEQDEARAAFVAVLKRADAAPNIPRPIRQHAQLLRFFFDGQELLFTFVQTLNLASDPLLAGFAFDKDPARVAAEAAAKIVFWQSSLGALLVDIQKSANVPLYCEALVARDLCQAMIISNLALGAAMRGEPLPEVQAGLIERVRQTREIAIKFDQIEMELRTFLIESDLEDLAGDRSRADELARIALSKAEALQYPDVARAAAGQLDGRLRSSSQIAAIQELRDGGFDAVLAAETDDALAVKANDSCDMLRLPKERLPVVLDAAKCEREVSRERMSFCRHLVVLEAASHTADRSVLFLRKPERCCSCRKLGHQSLVPSVDWLALLGAFKKNWCQDCPEANPLQPRSPAAPQA